MELQAVTGQRYIGDDGSRDASPINGLLALSAPSQAARGRHKDMLFVHLTLSGRPQDIAVLSQDIVDSISSQFYKTPGSVTAALKKAITQSNQQLLHYNVSGAATPREGALTCAVLRGEELFVVQVGESFALLGHNFGIERLPPATPQKITPLGQTAGLDLRFTHNWLQTGDMLLLADPRLAHLPTAAFEPALTDVDVEDGLEQLSEIVGDEHARVLLVEFTDEAPGQLPGAGQVQTASVSRQLAPPTVAPLREGESVADIAAPSAVTPIKPGIDVEVVETKARKATSVAALSLSGLTAWLADLLSSLHSPESEQGESESWAIPALLAILIPLIVAIVVGGVYIQRGNVLRLSEIQTEMRQKLTQAQVATVPEEAQAMYLEVIALADEATALRSNDAEVALLRESASNALDDMAGIGRLNGRLLHSYGSESALTSISLEGEEYEAIYILDDGGNRVYRHATDATLESETIADPEVILFGEQVIGNHITGRLADTMWRPQGNNVERDGLAVLDGRGALISFYPNLGDVRAVPLGLASDWQLPSQITFFSERLYILDRGAAVIWRYLPEGEGFNTSEGQRFIELPADADLANVVDFAIISRDGSIMLLYADGRLRHYAGDALLWSESDLAESGLESPMVAPASVKVVGSGLNSSIFVADPGSDRILQFSVGGTFLAQYKAYDELGQELFGRTSDFAVIENPLRIFVVAGDKLYMASKN